VVSEESSCFSGKSKETIPENNSGGGGGGGGELMESGYGCSMKEVNKLIANLKKNLKVRLH